MLFRFHVSMLKLLMLVICSGLSLSVNAIDRNRVVVNVTGEMVYPPPCRISSVVDVDLGDVIFDLTNASFIDLPVSINCAAARKNQLTYAIRGEGMPGDQQYVIKTSIEHLGVTFSDAGNTDEEDGGRVNIRKTYNFDKNSVPKIRVGAFHFTAIPFDKKPIPGSFTAAATLEIGYQ